MSIFPSRFVRGALSDLQRAPAARDHDGGYWSRPWAAHRSWMRVWPFCFPTWGARLSGAIEELQPNLDSRKSVKWLSSCVIYFDFWQNKIKSLLSKSTCRQCPITMTWFKPEPTRPWPRSLWFWSNQICFTIFLNLILQICFFDLLLIKNKFWIFKVG